MSEEDPRAKPALDSDAKARAAYQTWKWSVGVVPWRFPLSGFLILVLALVVFGERLWLTPSRWALIAMSLFFLSGALCLFYDIPRKRLSRFSRVVLFVGTVGPFVLLMLAMLWHRSSK